MRLRNVLFVITAFGAGVFAAEAKQTTLRRSDLGVLGAMKRLHCSPEWLSEVMWESRILLSELNSLPVGKRIVAPDGCANSRPGRETRRATTLIFAHQNTLKNLREELALAREKLAGSEASLRSVREQSENWRVEAEKRDRELKSLNLELPKLRIKHIGWGALAGLMFALVVCIGLWGFGFMVLRKRPII
jgi:hypothetical protein